MNDIFFTKVHNDINNRVTENFNTQDVVYVEANQDTVNLFQQQSCLSNCFDRGTCDKGELFYYVNYLAIYASYGLVVTIPVHYKGRVSLK